eukprot:c24369_g1_i2 orf=775-2379(+)
MGSCFSDIAGGKLATGGIGEERQDEVLEAVHALTSTRGLSSVLELSLSASNLRNRDTFSKSDPITILYAKRRDGSMDELGRTEVILNSLAPVWVTKLKLSYNFEEVQALLFQVYDVDTKFGNIPPKNIPIQQQQFLGQLECALSEIVTAPNRTLTRSLQDRKNPTGGTLQMQELGVLTIKAEEMVYCKSVVELIIGCSNLANMDFFTRSDPFLRISRLYEDGSFIPVYKTEVKKNDLNPTWKPISMTLQQLCNGDMDCPLKFECFNFNSSGRHDLIGATQTSLNEIKTIFEHQDGKDLIQPSGGHALNKVRGKIFVKALSISVQPTFLDYIFGGFELSFLVAVDFTASNGNPYQRDSLHYVDPSGRPNDYQTAIIAVGEVLEYFDTDKKFTAWGFGGRPYHNGPVSHCFSLSGDQRDAEVVGVQGILHAYGEAVRRVILAGPTIFGPIINAASALASDAMLQGKQMYYVLLIITDGVITDLQESINALVRASDLPLSVLIVGVGGADFTEMDILDADKRCLASTEFEGKVAVRD